MVGTVALPQTVPLALSECHWHSVSTREVGHTPIPAHPCA